MKIGISQCLIEWQARAYECIESPDKIDSFKMWIKTQAI